MASRKGEKQDFTRSYLEGDFDPDRIERLDGSDKSKQKQKIRETSDLRNANAADVDALPLGQVRQVFSLYLEARVDGKTVLCTSRKTLGKLRDTAAVAGDLVRVRLQQLTDRGAQEGVIERVEPRKTVLTRADSFKAREQHPIVANATQMLVVVSVALPRPKWGLVDRMLVAAVAGGLRPIVCLNKIDLGEQDPGAMEEAHSYITYYRSLGFRAEETCATRPGSEAILADILKDQSTVVSGHSGVGKSSLIRRLLPGQNIRVGDVSTVNEKGKHTTTSARIYDIPEIHAEIIDTPGVKLFGLWKLDEENLGNLFPDIAAGTAPDWRQDSYRRIRESL
jgi:ribosome biogenesis GTPase